MNRPIAPGQVLDLVIDSLAYGASGVARHGDFVVFVRGGFPGERVRAHVARVKRQHAEAEAREVLVPSAERVPAPCAHYPACGGCRMQDLAYAAQARAKEQQVREAVARIGGVREVALEPIVPADAAFHYRNKMEYTFAATPAGPAPGLHRAGRHDRVLEIERCWLTTEVGNVLRDTAREWARAEGLPAYDVIRHEGRLRNLVVREGRSTGQALVLLVTTSGDVPGLARLVDRLRAYQAVRAIHWAENDRLSEVTNLPTRLLWGERAIEEEILGLRFLVGPTSFLQPNTAMCERLYRIVVEYAALGGSEVVYDLYCGIGTIGLQLASRAASVWGVELSAEAIELARENARRNGIANASYVAGDVAAVVDGLTVQAGAPDLVVVDPPRAGLSPKALARVGRLGAPRLVYVSCNPTTLARDAKALVEEHGYRLERARPVDMFPHTAHIETVALFTR